MIELEPPMNRASFRLFPHLNNGVGKLSGVLNKPAISRQLWDKGKFVEILNWIKNFKY